MNYKTLGKSGLEISVIGFGGIPIQRLAPGDAAEVVLRAGELGINFIDTARGYTVSEEYIGEALKGRRDKWIIASKSMSRDEESMNRDIETSLKNLQTDYIDLYQIHNIRTQQDFERAFGKGGAYEALISAKKRGKVGHVGVTSHSLDMLRYIIENTDIETVMYPYSIVETQAEDVFKRAAELGTGIMAMKPLAGGAIEDGALAMKFILSNKCITAALPGMASIREVEQNVSAVDGFISLTEIEEEKINKISKDLSGEFCRRCSYCAPCPQGIDIPSMLLFQGYKKRYNLAEWAEARYFACNKRAKDCTGCGTCEPKCPYGLPIRKLMEEVKTNFDDLRA